MTGQTFATGRKRLEPVESPGVGERVRLAFPTPGPRMWAAAGMVLAAAGVLSQAFEVAAR
jgi:hypothetical protein